MLMTSQERGVGVLKCLWSHACGSYCFQTKDLLLIFANGAGRV